MAAITRRADALRLRLPGMLSLVLAVVPLATRPVAADLTQDYCSTSNTADTPSSFSHFQSLGLCQTTCSGSYGLAVVQGFMCWCTNYIPASTTSVAQCSMPCHGYPYENCGNADNNLFGYMVIDQAAILGTAGATSAKSTQSPSPTPSSSAQAQTIHDTVTISRSLSTFSSSPSSLAVTQSTPKSSNPKSSKSSSTSTSTSATWTPRPITTVLIKTVSNQPVTQTVTSGPTATVIAGVEPQTTTSTLPKKDTKSGTSGGLIAGVVVATIVGVLFIVGALLFFWRRRRQQQAESNNDGIAPEAGGRRPARNTSILSRTGLIDRVYSAGTGAQRGQTNNQIRNGSADANDTNGEPRPDMGERRNSRPLFYDQRLNPSALMDIDNASRVSVNTIPDNRDFSRTLNVMNPDI